MTTVGGCLTIALATAAAIAAAEFARAHDNPRFAGTPAQLKAWFHDLRSPRSGTPCCDEADGHLTTYRVTGNTYWVQIDGRWVSIPSDLIVRNSGNPTGEGVIFYEMVLGERDDAAQPLIYCFVPNDTN